VESQQTISGFKTNLMNKKKSIDFIARNKVNISLTSGLDSNQSFVNSPIT